MVQVNTGNVDENNRSFMGIISYNKQPILRQWKNNEFLFQDFNLEMMKGLMPNKNAINFISTKFRGDLHPNDLMDIFSKRISSKSVEVLSKDLINFLESQDIWTLISPEIIENLGGDLNYNGVTFFEGNLIFYNASFKEIGYSVEIFQFKGQDLICCGCYLFDFRTNKTSVINAYNYKRLICPYVILWSLIKNSMDEDYFQIKKSSERKIFEHNGKRIFNPDGVSVNIYNIPMLQEIKGSFVKPCLAWQWYGPNKSLGKYIIRKGHVRKNHLRVSK